MKTSTPYELRIAVNVLRPLSGRIHTNPADSVVQLADSAFGDRQAAHFESQVLERGARSEDLIGSTQRPERDAPANLWRSRVSPFRGMENSSSSEVLAAAQGLRRFHQYLNEQAVAQTKSLPATNAGVRQGDDIGSRSLAETQTVDDIIAKLVAWTDQLKQRQNINRSHVQSI